MKLKTWELWVVLLAVYIPAALTNDVNCNYETCQETCSKKTVNIKGSIVLLGIDGFVGRINEAYSNVLYMPNNSLNRNNSHDCHVLSSNDSKVYSLKVTRTEEPDVVCLIKGQTWSTEVCNTSSFTNSLACNTTDPRKALPCNTIDSRKALPCNTIDSRKALLCEMFNNKSLLHDLNKTNIICLKPTNICHHVEYRVCDTQENVNVIDIHPNGTTSCYKCGSPELKMKEVYITSTDFQGTEVKAERAVETMKNLQTLLPHMQNITEICVCMGNVRGALKKINEAIPQVTFTYSPVKGISILQDMDKIEKFPDAFTIPKEASGYAFNKTNGTALLGVFRFPNMTKDENNLKVLNDDVFAIEMGTEISNLTERIRLSFNNTLDSKTLPICVSWNGNGSKPTWVTDGCNTSYDDNKITCSCNHLTFFAVLMSPVVEPISTKDLQTLTYITYIGCGLSMFFLGIGLFMHFLLRKAKASNSVHVLINLFVALFLLNLTFLSNEYVANMNNDPTCRVIAGFMHYCMLASFTWFAVEAFHLCLQMAKPTVTIDHYIMKISVVGWVPPALIVAIFFFLGKYGKNTIQTDTSTNGTMCWITDSTLHYAVNIGYYCFIFIFTFSTFIVVLRWICMLRQKKWSNMGKMKGAKTGSGDITTIMGLCCLLGLTWSFSFFSYGAMRLPSYYIFTILNSFQGLFLFVYYIKSSALFGDAVPEESSQTSEDITTENPYVE